VFLTTFNDDYEWRIGEKAIVNGKGKKLSTS
jgi:hypothetical protein